MGIKSDPNSTHSPYELHPAPIFQPTATRITMSEINATPAAMVERYFDLAAHVIETLNTFKTDVSRILAIDFNDLTDEDHKKALAIWTGFQDRPLPRLGPNEHILPVLTPAEAVRLARLTKEIGNLESEVYILYITLTPRVSGYVTQEQREAGAKKSSACLCN